MSTMTDGTCYLCGDTYTKRGMTRHLRACKNDHEATSTAPTVHLVVSADHRPDYWLHLGVDPEATLADLDGFLRDVWLECCGHLSAFITDFGRYENASPGREPVPGPDGRSMDIPIGEVRIPDDGMAHEYDYGTTSRQSLRVVEAGSAVRGPTPPGHETIGVYARNQPPSIPCGGDDCGSDATTICRNHVFGGGADGWLCDDCAADHDCAAHWLGSIVNSPRTGLCGFEGAELTAWAPT